MDSITLRLADFLNYPLKHFYISEDLQVDSYLLYQEYY